MEKEKIHLVWFKKDLRVTDHLPLVQAAQCGMPALGLYVVETQYWKGSHLSASHYGFVRDCILNLQEKCSQAGIGLVVLIRDHALEISEAFEIEKIWAHQETGDHWTFQRDLAVRGSLSAVICTISLEKQNFVARGRIALKAYRNFSQDFWKSWAHTPPPNTLKHGGTPK